MSKEVPAAAPMTVAQAPAEIRHAIGWDATPSLESESRDAFCASRSTVTTRLNPVSRVVRESES